MDVRHAPVRVLGPIDLDAIIDALEGAGADVDYDSGATYCRVTIPQFPAEIVSDDRSLRLVHSSPCPPRELVTSFKEFRELAAQQNLQALLVA